MEQVSQAVKFLAFFVASKVGKTGLADVTVDVYDPAGAQIVTAAVATAVGGGLYSYTLAGASTGAEGEYVAVFKTADASVDQRHIPALWVVGRAGVEHLDAAVSSRLADADYAAAPTAAAVADQVWDEASADHVAAGSTGAKLALLGTGTVNVTAPVSSDGNTVTVKQGHAYNAADSLALEWTVSGYPTFVGASVSVRIQTPTLTTLAGSVVDADTLRLELTEAQSAALAEGSWAYDVDVTLASGRVVTPVSGDFVVEAQVS